MIEEIPARKYHCGPLSRTLRAEHRKLLENVPTHQELRDAFDTSIMVKAWTLDGHVIALAGVSGTTAASAEGNIWLAMSDEAAKHPLAVVRRAMKFLDEAMLTKRRLATYVLEGDHPGVQLAIMLGFDTHSRQTVKGLKVRLMTYALRKAA